MKMELKDDRQNLEFEVEHYLSKKPLQIDMLIIKKNVDVSLKNNIGALFKKFNLIEYKSPDDELGIDVFFKVIGYACLYKNSASKENAYKAEQITITLIRQRYPKKLMTYLKENGYTVKEVASGIYYITGKIMFSMQIVVSSRLSAKEHIWLHSLRNNISQQDFQQLLDQIQQLEHKEKENYGEAVL